jgi:hypothetical protein
VGICAAGNYGHDPRYCQLRALFDRPFHPVEFENSEQKCDARHACSGYFFPELELDSSLMDDYDTSAPHDGARGDIEFLPHASAQDAD